MRFVSQFLRRLIRRSQDDKSDGLVRPRGDGNSDGELPDVNPIRAKAKTKAHDWPLLKSNSLVAKRHDPKEFALSVQSKVSCKKFAKIRRINNKFVRLILN